MLAVMMVVCGALLPTPARGEPAPVDFRHVTSLYYASNNGCLEDPALPCVSAGPVDYDQDGTQEYQVCVTSSPYEAGCAQVPITQLEHGVRHRWARVTMPLTLLLTRPEGEVVPRQTTVHLAFAAVTPLVRERTYTDTINEAGCVVRAITITKSRSGQFAATFDGATYTSDAHFGVLIKKQRTFC